MNLKRFKIGSSFKEGFTIIDYRFIEYLGIYDNNNFIKRLKWLKLGAQIYFNSGFSFYQFLQFHKKKQLTYSFGSYIICIVFFIMASCIFFSGGPLCLSFLSILLGIILRMQLLNSNIKANILHVNKMLSDNNGLENLIKLMEIQLEDEASIKNLAESICWGHTSKSLIDIPVLSNVSTYPKGLTEGQVLDFQEQLNIICNLPNKFNSMPMREVVEFFAIMCCDSCKMEIPQMTQQDFITFLKNAFIAPIKGQKITLTVRKLMITYQIFHQYYLTCYNKMYACKDGQIELYISLLTDHIEGFVLSKVKNNFRTNDDYLLMKIRSKYKFDLQNLQPLQTIEI